MSRKYEFCVVYSFSLIPFAGTWPTNTKVNEEINAEDNIVNMNI
jgi:hypothetical protein